MKPQRLLSFILLASITATVQADQDTGGSGAPTSTAAVAAKTKHDQAAKKAEMAYVKALLAADQAYVDALARAEDLALRTGLSGEAEAERIKAERTNTLADLERLKQNGAPATSQRYTVYSWRADKIHLVYFLDDGEAVDTERNPMRWMIVHGRMLLLWSDGNTKWMDISKDKKTMTGGSDTDTLVDPSEVPPPPTPKDEQ